MAEEFRYDSKRDAWAVIRGFRYQIELTVLRWLDLDDQTILYCECGEDIDHVAKSLGQPNVPESRLLEQIKTRDKLTLRSSEALAAMTHYRSTVRANPETKITYRFTTTARPASERRFTFPRATGIESWTVARKGELSESELEQLITSLRALVADAPCPSGLSTKQFQEFRTFVGSVSGTKLVDKLIKPFEWAIAMPPPSQMATKISRTLLEQGRANNKQEARLLAEVLVTHVLQFLSRSGEKRLEMRELEELLKDRSLTAIDRRLLTQLETFTERADSYLERMSTQMDQLGSNVGMLLELPALMHELQDKLVEIETRWTPTQVLPADSPPRLPEMTSARATLVDQLNTSLNEYGWLAISAASGMGKTVTAALLFESYPSTDSVWISLQGEQHSQLNELASRLDNHFLRLATIGKKDSNFSSSLRHDIDVRRLVRAAIQNLGNKPLIVIDELPDLIQAKEITTRLSELSLALSREGKHGVLLTTSQRPLPAFTGESGLILERQLPGFNKSEIEELLRKAGADPTSLALAAIIHGTTQGHPALVRSTIAFMVRQNWSVDTDTLQAIFSGDTAGQAREEAQRRVFQLVPDNARELLCRLSLIGSQFNRELMDLVAAVEPSIKRPGELLLELTGPWITELQRDSYEVSPLLSDIGRSTLDESSKVRLHGTLLEHYLTQRSVDFSMTIKIIVHATGANEFTRLAWFLLQLVLQLKTQEQAAAFPVISALYGSGWPERMDRTARILITAAQVRYLEVRGESSQPRFEELMTLVEQATDQEQVPAYTSMLLTGPMNPSAKPADASRRGLLAWRIYPRLPPEMREQLPLMPLSAHIWSSIIEVQARSDLDEIFGLLSQMTEKEREATLDSEQWPHGISFLLDLYLNLEMQRNGSDDEWERVLEDLAQLEELAALPGAEKLKVPIDRTKAIILGDFLDKPQEALATLSPERNTVTADEMALLRMTAGCIKLDHFGAKAACREFEEAFASASADFLSEQLNFMVFAVESAARAASWSVAFEWALRLHRKSRKDESIDQYKKLEIIGEIAWIHWSLGNKKKAWGSMAGLVRSLLHAGSSGAARYREVFNKTGHVLGWMLIVAETGHPPTHTGEGEPYTTPFPGLFIRTKPAMAQPSNLQPAILSYLLARFGVSLYLYREAKIWFSEARKSAVAEHDVPLLYRSEMEFNLANLAAREGKYTDALTATLRSLDFTVEMMRAGQGEQHTPTANQSRAEIQRMAFWPTIGVAISQLLVDDAESQDFARAIKQLQTAFQLQEHRLEDPLYWRQILEVANGAFKPDVTRDEILNQRKEALASHDSKLHSTILLDLAIARASKDVTVEEICVCHAEIYALLLLHSAFCQPMLRNVGTTIVSTWKYIANNRAFALRTPQLFRSTVESISGNKKDAISKLLLAATEATGIQLPARFRIILKKAAAGESVYPPP